MSSKKSTRNRSHSRKRSKSRGRASSKGGSTRKRSTSRGKGKLKKSIVRRHYRGGAEIVSQSSILNKDINGNVDIVVAQDTFLIVSNYDDNSICYYSMEDDPNENKNIKTNYVFKAYLSKPGEGVVSNVAVQEVKDKNSGKVKTFLFYFVGARLVCLEVNLKHNKEYIVDENIDLFIDYAKKKVSFTSIRGERKYIVFYKNPDTNTHNLCYTTLDNGELKFSEIALIMNPSKFEIYSVSMIRSLGKSNDLYSFCFISNNLMAFLISNTDQIDLPEIKIDELDKYTTTTDKNKYTSIEKDDMKFIKIRNTRYFTSPNTYKLMYYQYNYNKGSSNLMGGATTSYVAFSPNYVRYSEIQGTDYTKQKSRGMVYNDNNIYINFNKTISKFRIPPECIFNHYLTMKKLGNRIETSGWKDFALHFDDRITFVQKLKDYNSKKNAGGNVDNKYKNAVRVSVGPFITENEEKDRIKKTNDILIKLKQRRTEEEQERNQKIENERRAQQEKEDKAKAKKAREEAEAKAKKAREEAERVEQIKKQQQDAVKARQLEQQQQEDATSFKSKSWFKNPFATGGDELEDEAKRLYEKTSAPLFGKKKTIDDLIKDYEPTEVEIQIAQLKEQAEEGKELVDNEEARTKLADKILNRYKYTRMDGQVDYNEAGYKKYATNHENDQIQNYDYDFLYFDRTDIPIEGAVGLTLYEGNLLTVTNANTITAVTL
jgi:hypothetical protein